MEILWSWVSYPAFCVFWALKFYLDIFRLFLNFTLHAIFLSFIQLYVSYLSPCIFNSKILAAGWILYSTLKLLEIWYLTTYFVCMAILWPPVTLWGILESFLTRMCPLVCMFITYVWLLSCICIISQKWQGRPKKLSKTGIKTEIYNCVITFNFHLTGEWKKKGFSVFPINSVSFYPENTDVSAQNCYIGSSLHISALGCIS